MAAVRSWPIDASRSHAQFSIRTLWFTHLRGEFDALHGHVSGYAARDVVDAWIDADSLTMEDANALREARGPKFFDVQRYPRIHFISAPFPAAALATGGDLSGMLDLHGQRRLARFTLLPSACPVHPLDCPVRVHGELSRADFGMHAHRGVLSDHVTLNMNIVLATKP